MCIRDRTKPYWWMWYVPPINSKCQRQHYKYLGQSIVCCVLVSLLFARVLSLQMVQPEKSTMRTELEDIWNSPFFGSRHIRVLATTSDRIFVGLFSRLHQQTPPSSQSVHKVSFNERPASHRQSHVYIWACFAFAATDHIAESCAQEHPLIHRADSQRRSRQSQPIQTLPVGRS